MSRPEIYQSDDRKYAHSLCAETKTKSQRALPLETKYDGYLGEGGYAKLCEECNRWIGTMYGQADPTILWTGDITDTEGGGRVDCSGFVQAIYDHFWHDIDGAYLGGGSSGIIQKANRFRTVGDDEVMPCDILKLKKGGHVALYVGEGHCFESSKQYTACHYTDKDVRNDYTKYRFKYFDECLETYQKDYLSLFFVEGGVMSYVGLAAFEGAGGNDLRKAPLGLYPDLTAYVGKKISSEDAVFNPLAVKLSAISPYLSLNSDNKTFTYNPIIF